jgi:vacuolar-type H+-ATPase subunit E/Vma4
LGIDELVDRLERDADARVASIEARAQAEVQAIEAAAEQVSAQARDAALARRRTERRARLDREITEARKAARADRLRAQHAALDRALSRAAAWLDAIDRDEAYLAALPERLEEALRFVGERAARVRCRPPLGPRLRDAVAGRPEVTVEEVPAMAAGFSVVTRDGSMEVDDTLPARLARLRPRLLIELLAEVDR